MKHDKHEAAAIGAIQNINDRAGLRYVERALRRQADIIERRARLEFNVGQRVSFTSRGQLHIGHVVKVMTKNIKVDVDGTLWRVGPTLLAKETA